MQLGPHSCYIVFQIFYISRRYRPQTRMPIITLGTKWSISIDWTSGVGCNEFGYPTLLITQLKTIVQSMGDRKFVGIHYWQIPGGLNLQVPTLPCACNELHQYVQMENLKDSTDGCTLASIKGIDKSRIFWNLLLLTCSNFLQ